MPGGWELWCAASPWGLGQLQAASAAGSVGSPTRGTPTPSRASALRPAKRPSRPRGRVWPS
eukprot:4254598-Alexandrium_andersonii.AAC.1